MKKVCTVLHEEELGAILEKLRVIREYEDMFQDWRAHAPKKHDVWDLVMSCKDLFKCLLIIDDDKRREVISESHGRKHDERTNN